MSIREADDIVKVVIELRNDHVEEIRHAAPLVLNSGLDGNGGGSECGKSEESHCVVEIFVYYYNQRRMCSL